MLCVYYYNKCNNDLKCQIKKKRNQFPIQQVSSVLLVCFRELFLPIVVENSFVVGYLYVF